MEIWRFQEDGDLAVSKSGRFFLQGGPTSLEKKLNSLFIFKVLVQLRLEQDKIIYVLCNEISLRYGLKKLILCQHHMLYNVVSYDIIISYDKKL